MDRSRSEHERSRSDNDNSRTLDTTLPPPLPPKSGTRPRPSTTDRAAARLKDYQDRQDSDAERASRRRARQQEDLNTTQVSEEPGKHQSEDAQDDNKDTGAKKKKMVKVQIPDEEYARRRKNIFKFIGMDKDKKNWKKEDRIKDIKDARAKSLDTKRRLEDNLYDPDRTDSSSTTEEDRKLDKKQDPKE